MPSSTASRHPPPSLPSTISLNRVTSTKSSCLPPISNVVTSPPWAKDEPPSPKEDQQPMMDNRNATESRPSDVASYLSSSPTATSRWWSFTRQRDPLLNHTDGLQRPERRGFAGRSISWLNTAAAHRESLPFARRDREKQDTNQDAESVDHPWSPPPPPAALQQSSLRPGLPEWNSIPWTPHARGSHARLPTQASADADARTDDPNKHLDPWSRRGKRLRNFILTNTYVPLLFRFINIAFTTAALGMAIRIRQLEIANKAMGALGSSPTVVIIFAPLTLVHVMVAIYLEYFGRPLGLWRTSAKLAHTLSEVLFICAWSAALSLCFDNFFTSLVPCASPSHMSWYNQLTRPATDVPSFTQGFGEQVCDDQLSLICLVGVGLLVYCANLIISLFRIFEKVKYQPAAAPPLP